MSQIDHLLSRLHTYAQATAILRSDGALSYAQLLERYASLQQTLDARQCRQQSVLLIADYTPNALALLLALWRNGNTVALVSSRPVAQRNHLSELCEAQWIVHFDADDVAQWCATNRPVQHPLLCQLRDENAAGLVIFSSGSTGKAKAIVHRVSALMARHEKRRKCLRTIAFLLFDHIGGINTLFYVLFNGGTLVLPVSRRPTDIAKAIAEYRVQAMTTSPTFLNLLLLSGACDSHDLSTMEIINYSSEPMPESTLQRLREKLPNTKLSQAYGMSEIGVVPARSRSSGSVWVKLGGEGTELRVVEGLLEVKNTTTMLGYLSEDNCMTTDGFFRTGDAVEQDGDYFRILGRSSELINIGGEKVYPAEIESVLRELPNVAEVVINQENNAITGKLIKATFVLVEDETLADFKLRLKLYCAEKLAPYQIPRKVILSHAALHNERYKKVRV